MTNNYLDLSDTELLINLFSFRNVVIGVSAFRQSGLDRAQRRKSNISLDEIDKCSTGTGEYSLLLMNFLKEIGKFEEI